ISHTGLPGKPIVVTIDDGYSDIYQFAYPVAKQYGIKLSLFIPTGLLENPGYMSWSNLKDMVGSGMVFAYDHTWSHYSLPRGTRDKEEYEIMTAKKQLEDHLGGSNVIFAYPYGTSNALTVSILAAGGFKGAFTTIPGFLQCDGFIYSLHRNRIGNAPLSAYGL
ncbi:MAG: polysaccharide deacetylase family protein, partial [Candidatus Levyibacteriota bacterium]